MFFVEPEIRRRCSSVEELGSYPLLTPWVEIKKSNPYRFPWGAILDGFSNTGAEACVVVKRFVSQWGRSSATCRCFAPSASIGVPVIVDVGFVTSITLRPEP
jgi:hypothetical protein